jgi:integrase
MARLSGKLTQKDVDSETRSGRFSDGNGLYLQVREDGKRKSWIFRFMRFAKAREMGLGSADTVSVEEARKKAIAARLKLLDLKDPLDERREAKRLAEEAARSQITFAEAAEEFIRIQTPSWRNPKHAQQWSNTIATYAAPVIGKTIVSRIDEADILRILQPIWLIKHETAFRLRGRMERIFDWCIARKSCERNPAKWAGMLEYQLANLSRAEMVESHAAMPFSEIPAFMEKLRQTEGTAARALEFIILTASRTSEVINASWDEIDLEAGQFVIPGSRMKAKQPHTVMLSAEAKALLEALPRKDGSPFIFPGRDPKKPLSNMAALKLLKERLGFPNLTVHGFRAAFSTWANEITSAPSEIVESCLAHAVKSAVQKAYHRGTWEAKRAELMREWARFCHSTPAPANVVKLKGAA